MYFFRILAENEYGVGLPVDTTEAIKISERPLPPGKVTLKEVTGNSVTLSWEKPDHDGGSRITGYTVEMQGKNSEKWTQVMTVKVTEAVVVGLTQGEEYFFRISATNEKGTSDPRPLSVPVVAMDVVIAPAFKLLFSTFSVLAGDDLKIDVPYVAQPKAAVTWQKDGIALKETTRVNTRFEVKKLLEKHEYKFRICAINKVGVGETADIPGSIIIEDKLEAPDIDLDADLRKMITVRAGGSLRLFVPIRGRPTPEVKWGKAEGEINEAAQIDITSSFTSLIIENVNRFDSGKYTLTLENASGTKSAFISVRVLDNPDAPANFHVKEITNNSVTLSWEPPLLDGGAKIKNYIVEKRESTRKVYSAVGTCNKMTWKIEPLQEGSNFFFRVLAENEHGIGLPAETLEPIKISEVPQPPGKVSVVDVTRKSVSLKWEKPEHDGGSRITYYEVEMQAKDQDKWSLCAQVKSLDTVVTNLVQGKSDPRLLANPVVAKDLAIQPTVRTKLSTYNVQVGQDLKIEARISGHPKPTITWTKDGSALKQTTRVNVADTAHHTTLTIKDATREDGGMYNIAVANVLGQAEATVEIIILEKPGPPTGPVRIDEVSRDSVQLQWEPPQIDGGARITHYIVEKRESKRLAFTTVTNSCVRNSFKVDDLQEGGLYHFRVLAVNELGVGLPAETIEAVKVSQAPLPPGKITVVDVTRHTITLAWEKPDHDGGSKITGYTVEMITKGSDKWTVCATVKALETTIEGLTTGEEYSFRIAAVNDKGKSDPKPLGASVVARDITIEPIIDLLFNTYSVKAGDDLKIDVPFRGRPLPEVTWKKGGHSLKQTTRVNVLTSKTSSKIVIKDSTREDAGKYEIILTNSIGIKSAEISVIVLDKPGPPGAIKKRDMTTTAWQIVSATVARTSIKVTRLTQGTEYQFRVAAENRYGKSHAIDSAPVVAQYPFSPPGPPTSLHIAQATKSGMLVTWNRPASDVPFKGKPVPHVMWNKPDVDLRVRAAIDTTDNCTSITIEQATRDDSGKYTVTLQNVAGTSTLTLSVKVLDSPGPPAHIEIKEVTKSSATITWDTPENEGGAPVKNYLVDLREATKMGWTRITDSCPRLTFKVNDLQEGGVYYFRVTGENEYGIGVPLETKEGTKITGKIKLFCCIFSVAHLFD
uniref:Titin n=1 Tax=Sinocyclocheilus anshuiensis TaxID=1608454 RepID=A0A671KJU4_9TELE